jgi:hypothetical protein
MNPDTSPTPRTDDKCYKYDSTWQTLEFDPRAYHVEASFARQLECELSEKTNEVERLRELLSAQAEYITFLEKESEKTAVFLYAHHWRYPEEDFKKGESMRKVIKDAEAKISPAPEKPVSECIKLLADDVLKPHKEGDEMWISTRRPLPKPIEIERVKKQEEMPLEKELDYLTREASRASDINNHVLIVDCLRYLRDEIQKLKSK